MVCKPCSVAGDMVQVFRNSSTVLPKSIVHNLAIDYHDLCKGHEHCDCQHKIDFEGKAIKNG